MLIQEDKSLKKENNILRVELDSIIKTASGLWRDLYHAKGFQGEPPVLPTIQSARESLNDKQ